MTPREKVSCVNLEAAHKKENIKISQSKSLQLLFTPIYNLSTSSETKKIIGYNDPEISCCGNLMRAINEKSKTDWHDFLTDSNIGKQIVFCTKADDKPHRLESNKIVDVFGVLTSKTLRENQLKYANHHKNEFGGSFSVNSEAKSWKRKENMSINSVISEVSEVRSVKRRGNGSETGSIRSQPVNKKCQFSAGCDKFCQGITLPPFFKTNCIILCRE
jgi:hypothetical protein